MEIVSGREESRLIHLGVQARWPHPNRRLLIVDIGGGSAELIAGEHGTLRDSFSKPLGAVRLREIFLRHDPPLPDELHQMQEYVEEKLAGIAKRFGNTHWDRVIATSATASAVVCAVNRIPRTKRDQADRMRASAHEVRRLYKKLSVLDLAERRKATGIGPKRAEIIVPGVSVLLRVLEDFRLPCLYYSAAGVRDGIIADLYARGVGRELAQLSRDQRKEVEQMSRRYGVALPHARKVAALAHTLFTDLQPSAPVAAAFRQAAGSRRLSARCRPLRGRLQPSQALLLPGEQFRYARLHQSRARAHRQFVPLSPQEHAHTGALQLAGA